MNGRALVPLLASLVLGCEGERVESTTADAVVDAVTDGGACAPIAGNIVTDGDFTTGAGGWKTADCKVEIVAGRCAKGLRIYDVAPYGRVGRAYEAAFPAGTRLHLRAWFKKSATGARPPKAGAWVRSYSHDDAGAEHTDDYSNDGTVGDDWTLAETVFTLKRPQEFFEIFLEAGAGFEVEVADVSLVKE